MLLSSNNDHDLIPVKQARRMKRGSRDESESERPVQEWSALRQYVKDVSGLAETDRRINEKTELLISTKPN